MNSAFLVVSCCRINIYICVPSGCLLVESCNKDIMNVFPATTPTHAQLFLLLSHLPLRCCPSSRSFTTWKTEILIMSTWPSLSSSSSPRTTPSIALSMKWWVDTTEYTLCTFHAMSLKPFFTCNGGENCK